MALLDDLFLPGGGFSAPQTAGFDPVTKEPLTEAEMAAARDVALKRGAKSVARIGALTDPNATAFAVPIPSPVATDPIASEPQLFQNGVPMPRPRPAEADGPAPLSLAPPIDDGILPAMAAPTAGIIPPMQQPAQPQAMSPAPPPTAAGPSLIDRIFNPNHAATMLALGSGFAGAPSFGTGMRRAFGAAVPAMASDRAFEQKQTGIAETYRALVARGVPPAEALAAVNNPDVMKATVAKFFETKPRVPHKIGTDVAGNDIMGSFDPNKGQFFNAAGQPMDAGTVAPNQAFEQKQAAITETYKALIARGVSPQEASAAVNNPDIMKATAAKYFETKQRVPHKLGTDLQGNDIMGSFDPNNGKFFDAAGQEIKPGGAGGAAIPSAGGGLLAKGVDNYNSELIGPDYLAQFSPEVQSAIKAYQRGDTQPTGNPRLKGFETKVKEWARKYGDDVGIPTSDALFSERRKYRTELGSNTATSAGGQAKAFNQGIEHADALATKLEGLGNKDPLGIPAVAHGINWAREKFSTRQKGLADEARTIGQTLAGEVGKLFSGSAGGGVHERELTRQRFDTITSPLELAGALEGTLDTMRGGLTALEQRRDQVLGPNSDVNFVNGATREKMARIETVIRRLKGEEPPLAAPAAPARPAAPPAPGRYQWDPQAGLRPIQ